MPSGRKNKRRPVYARARGSPPPPPQQPAPEPTGEENIGLLHMPKTEDLDFAVGMMYSAMRNAGMTLTPIDTYLPVFDRTTEPTPTPALRDFTLASEYRSTTFPELRRLFYSGDRPEPQSPSPAGSILSEADLEALMATVAPDRPDYEEINPIPDTDSDSDTDDETNQRCGVCWQQFSKESLQSTEFIDGARTEMCEKCQDKTPDGQRITLVVSQTGSTHEVARAALENCSWDVVDAIMQLTC